MADFFAGQNAAPGLKGLISIWLFVCDCAGLVANAVSCEIVSGVDRDDTRRRSGISCVDGVQTGMCPLRSHDDGVKHSGQAQVIDIVALAGNETVVFNPALIVCIRAHVVLPRSRA